MTNMLANGTHDKKDHFPFYCLIDYEILDQLLYCSLHTWLYFALVVISVIISVNEIIQEIPQPPVTEISLKITCLKFHSTP